jgi:hypothetical protein
MTHVSNLCINAYVLQPHHAVMISWVYGTPGLF